MTICVAAICGKGQYVALATDTLKVNGGNVISGTAECKIKSLSSNASLLYSGPSTHIERLIEKTEQDLHCGSILAVAQSVQRSYTDCLNALAEERFLLSDLGLSYAEYIATNVNDAEKIGEFVAARNELHFSSIVVGVDDSGAHIIQASPRLIEGSAGFDAIGIGSDIAQWSRRFLLLDEYNAQCSVVEGLFTVCFAKTVAQELGLAMGEDTDLAIQSRSGLQWINGKLKDELVENCKGRIKRLKLSKEEQDRLTSLFQPSQLES